MGTGAAQHQAHIILPIDQHPVGLDMAVAPTFPFSTERMVFVLRIEGAAIAQGLDDRMKFVQGLAALLLALHLPVELRRRVQV